MTEAPAGQSYEYGYGVINPENGDIKSAYERRNEEGNVEGEYRLFEPNGGQRIVSYTADRHGFNPTVQYLPPQK